ncbi:sugar transferase [Anaeromyxobacter sp. SG66]|uniref:sugar transferase n=1 Tax=Anaeromyxobacter sp. SG66 TaxID=2925410 RepID=UPI00272A0F18|nr:sugar transferase [Anaeromyxobacter sp. SG66]
MEHSSSSSYARTKRAMDVAFSATGVFLLSPLLVAVAIAVRLDSPGPVLFRHERVGRNGRKFGVLKFRSMTHGSRGAEVTAAGDPRITRVGRVLRRTKIDELPQLFNVLSGDMSLVGPRPEVARYVSMFSRDYEEILKVPPGITDPAAVEYRDEERLLAASADPEAQYSQVVLPAKIALYRRYLAERSLWTDLKIIGRTFAALIH